MHTRVLASVVAVALALAAHFLPGGGAAAAAVGPPSLAAVTVTRVHVEMPALSLETMAALATGIVHARVQSLRPSESPDGTVVTDVGLDVVSTIAGPHRPGLVVRMIGGVAGFRCMVVDAAPVLAPGDEIVAFLCGGGEGEDLGFLGLRHGVLRVQGPAGSETVSGPLAGGEGLAGFADQLSRIAREGR